MIKGICQDRTGMIWYISGKSLFCYDGHESIPFGSEELDGLGLINCCCISEDTLYLGCERGFGGFSLRDRHLSVSESMRGINIRAIVTDESDIWLGTDKGLFLNQKPVTTHPLLSDDIYSLLMKDAVLYIGTRSLFGRYQPQSGKVETIEKELKYVSSLLTDGNSREIYVGTASTLYKYITFGSAPLTQECSMPVVKCMCNDDAGNLLIGTDNGLFIKSGDRHIHHITHDARDINSIPGDIITAFFQDRDGNIWIGTDNGLCMQSKNQSVRTISLSSITHESYGNQIFCMLRDSKSRLWIGGSHGVIMIEHFDEPDQKYTWYRMNDPVHPIPHNKIRCFYEDRNSGIWIGGDGGLLHYDESAHSLQKYTIKGDGSNWIYRIRSSKDGIEVNTFNATHIFSPTTFEPNPAGEIVPTMTSDKRKLNSGYTSCEMMNHKWSINQETIEVKNLKSEAISTIRLPDRYLSIYADNCSGNIILGSTDRITIVNPLIFGTVRKNRQIYITNMEVNNETYRDYESIEQRDITLSHDQNSLLIYFSDFEFSQESMTKYAFMLR